MTRNNSAEGIPALGSRTLEYIFELIVKLFVEDLRGPKMFNCKIRHSSLVTNKGEIENAAQSSSFTSFMYRKPLIDDAITMRDEHK